MQRSSLLTVLVLLATAACAPEMGSDPSEELAIAEHELTAATLAKSAVANTTALASATLTAARAPLPPVTDVCDRYNGYTAAIASRTIDCLGTIGPRAYAVDARGNLQRTFKECTEDKAALEDIDSMLSLQLRTKELPEAQRCIAGRWASWQKQFSASGIELCPVWKKIETINAPTKASVEEFSKSLPKLPARENGLEPPMPHENYLAELRFPDGKADPRCKDEADCARQCIGGFAGAYIEGSGQKALIDPAYWLLSIDFVSVNPFMTPGFYHPMSYFGSLPGALYGHRHREGEACSRYVGGVHYLLTLVLDCIDPADAASCVSRCDEVPVATTGSGSTAKY
jgi:hypothetical protein